MLGCDVVSSAGLRGSGVAAASILTGDSAGGGAGLGGDDVGVEASLGVGETCLCGGEAGLAGGACLSGGVEAGLGQFPLLRGNGSSSLFLGSGGGKRGPESGLALGGLATFFTTTRFC